MQRHLYGARGAMPCTVRPRREEAPAAHSFSAIPDRCRWIVLLLSMHVDMLRAPAACELQTHAAHLITAGAHREQRPRTGLGRPSDGAAPPKHDTTQPC